MRPGQGILTYTGAAPRMFENPEDGYVYVGFSDKKSADFAVQENGYQHFAERDGKYWVRLKVKEPITVTTWHPAQVQEARTYLVASIQQFVFGLREIHHAEEAWDFEYAGGQHACAEEFCDRAAAVLGIEWETVQEWRKG